MIKIKMRRRRRRRENKNEEEEEEEEGNVVKKKDSLLSLTILIDFFQIADPTSTPHRPYIDPTSTPHRPYIDPTSTPFRKKSLSQSSTDTRNGVLRTVKITEK